MKVLVLGGTGMLGHAIHRVLHDGGLEVVASVRRDSPLLQLLPDDLRYVRAGDLSENEELERVVEGSRPDVVINAAGLIKQHREGGNLEELIRTNAVMPRRLEHLTRVRGTKLVHFSTDCVFAGTRGSYTEDDLPDATDVYGLSKFLGEVASQHCLTLRTSIIGCGLQPNSSLIDWFLGSSGTVKGYARALFSGLPVSEVGRLLLRILPPVAEGRLNGLYHLSAAPIDKLSLLRLVAARWGKSDVVIEPDEIFRIDRTLDSTRLRRDWGIVPADWSQMVDHMHAFYAAEAKHVVR